MAPCLRRERFQMGGLPFVNILRDCLRVWAVDHCRIALNSTHDAKNPVNEGCA